ncbi:hypothetical protein B484DRAFT_444911 [Ochromonadaceae sp. CCMP2298]|nr:hypothetical protein B484DRAFT_444911 [Ochromonadaceae sp. CCMP2298]
MNRSVKLWYQDPLAVILMRENLTPARQADILAAAMDSDTDLEDIAGRLASYHAYDDSVVAKHIGWGEEYGDGDGDEDDDWWGWGWGEDWDEDEDDGGMGGDASTTMDEYGDLRSVTPIVCEYSCDDMQCDFEQALESVRAPERRVWGSWQGQGGQGKGFQSMGQDRVGGFQRQSVGQGQGQGQGQGLGQGQGQGVLSEDDWAYADAVFRIIQENHARFDPRNKAGYLLTPSLILRNREKPPGGPGGGLGVVGVISRAELQVLASAALGEHMLLKEEKAPHGLLCLACCATMGGAAVYRGSRYILGKGLKVGLLAKGAFWVFQAELAYLYFFKFEGWNEQYKQLGSVHYIPPKKPWWRGGS